MPLPKVNLVYRRFCLKRLRPKLQKLRIAILGQFWLELALFFSFLIYMLCFSGKIYIQKFSPIIIKPLI